MSKGNLIFAFATDDSEQMMSRHFGDFVCIVMQEKSIESAVRIIQSNFSEVERQWEKGEERDIGANNEDVS